MNRTTLRTIAAFTLAPLVPSLLAAAFWPTRDAFLFELTIAYAVALVIGVPAYVLIQKHAEVTRPRVLRVSGWVGFATVLIPTLSPLLAMVCGVPLGLTAGLTFWLIWYRRSDVRART